MANAVRKGLLCVLSVNSAMSRTKKIQSKKERLILTKMLFVKKRNKKQKNALRLIIPSVKTAIIPAYSETSAPKEINKRGLHTISMSKI